MEYNHKICIISYFFYVSPNLVTIKYNKTFNKKSIPFNVVLEGSISSNTSDTSEFFSIYSTSIPTHPLNLTIPNFTLPNHVHFSIDSVSQHLLTIQNNK